MRLIDYFYITAIAVLVLLGAWLVTEPAPRGDEDLRWPQHPVTGRMVR